MPIDTKQYQKEQRNWSTKLAKLNHKSSPTNYCNLFPDLSKNPLLCIAFISMITAGPIQTVAGQHNIKSGKQGLPTAKEPRYTLDNLTLPNQPQHCAAPLFKQLNIQPLTPENKLIQVKEEAISPLLLQTKKKKTVSDSGNHPLSKKSKGFVPNIKVENKWTFDQFGNVENVNEAKLIIILEKHDDYITKLGQRKLTEQIIATLGKSGIQQEKVLLRIEGLYSKKQFKSYTKYLNKKRQFQLHESKYIKEKSEFTLDEEKLTSSTQIRVSGIEECEVKYKKQLKKIQNFHELVRNSESYKSIKKEQRDLYDDILFGRNRFLTQLLKSDLKSQKTDLTIVYIGIDHLRYPGKDLSSFLKKTPHLIFNKHHSSEILPYERFLKADYYQNKIMSKVLTRQKSYQLAQKAIKLHNEVKFNLINITTLPLTTPSEIKKVKETLDYLRSSSKEFFNIEMYYLVFNIEIQKKLVEICTNIGKDLSKPITKDTARKISSKTLTQIAKLFPYYLNSEQLTSSLNNIVESSVFAGIHKLDHINIDLSNWKEYDHFIQSTIKRLKLFSNI